MAGDDMLDQCRSGPWEADNKYGRAGGVAQGGLLTHQVCRKCRLDTFEPVKRPGFIIDDTLAHQSISLKDMLEGLTLIADIGEGLAQREMQIDPFFRVKPVDLLGRPLHGGEVRIGHSEAADIGKILVVTGLPRGQLGCRFHLTARFRYLT
jgi:hypothetical protein